MNDDLISRKSLIENLNKFAPEHYNALVNDLIAKEPTAFDKEEVIEELENLRAQYFITIANTGDEKLGFAYKYIWNALDHAIKIVEKGGIE